MNEATSTPLQFDRVVSRSAAPGQDAVATCKACGTAINTEYYQINGHVACASCRVRALNSAKTPGGITPLLVASLFGLGAGIVGAAIYYAVIALANLEIGIVAILIGYMVGYAVRRGAGGRGGRRFQTLAVALTYLSIALAYAPAAVQAPGGSDLMRALSVSVQLIAVLPIIVVFAAFPSGLISAAIIFFGMSQAWRMTATPRVDIQGPYRVGAMPEPQPV